MRRSRAGVRRARRGSICFLVLPCFAAFGLVQLLMFIKVFWTFVDNDDASTSHREGGRGRGRIRAGWFDGGARRGGHDQQAYEMLSAGAR